MSLPRIKLGLVRALLFGVPVLLPTACSSLKFAYDRFGLACTDGRRR
jgi:hypothetical protein